MAFSCNSSPFHMYYFVHDILKHNITVKSNENTVHRLRKLFLMATVWLVQIHPSLQLYWCFKASFLFKDRGVWLADSRGVRRQLCLLRLFSLLILALVSQISVYLCLSPPCPRISTARFSVCRSRLLLYLFILFIHGGHGYDMSMICCVTFTDAGDKLAQGHGAYWQTSKLPRSRLSSSWI